MSRRQTSSVAEDEIAQFSRHAGDWWNPDGVFKPLHRLNPIRMEYIRDHACAHFGIGQKRKENGMPAFAGMTRPIKTAFKKGNVTPAQAGVPFGFDRKPFHGLKILDVGCGGGLLTEPLARLGGDVTGLDASKEGIAAARAHAKTSGLKIDYRVGSVEELAEQISSFPRKRESRSASARHKTHTARGPGPLDPRLHGDDGRYDLITALEIAEHVADLDSFIEALASLLKPDGLLVMSTLNRTPKSFLLGIVAAEYILNWVPKGTHQWKKFLRPSELAGKLENSGLAPTDITGLIFNPLRGEFALSAKDFDVNYLLTAKKSERS